jgi:hypothetical protein
VVGRGHELQRLGGGARRDRVGAGLEAVGSHGSPLQVVGGIRSGNGSGRLRQGPAPVATWTMRMWAMRLLLLGALLISSA